mmetsp:Transcript_114620/g.331186  ORF Transcript_114620/g.331186 Transcript_114620/m.331186 type:complete len:234 (+) Transcript_114620:1147-1848(+)
MICAPATAEANTLTISPWIWNNGMVLLHTSSCFICTVDAMHTAPQAMFAWVSGTIFGFLVVPEVWSTSARSSRLTEAKGFPMGSPFNGRPAVCFFKVNNPAVSLLGKSSNNFSTLAFRATPIALPVCACSSSVKVSLSWTTKAFAGKSTNSNSYSSLLRPMLSGAKVHRKEKARKATAASGPFGMAVHNRSVRSRPKTSTSSLTQKAFNALRLSGFRPSVECKKGVSVSGRRS